MGCDQGGRFKDLTGRDEANITQDGATDLLEWMGIHICTSKTTTPSKRGSVLKYPHSKLFYFVYINTASIVPDRDPENCLDPGFQEPV